MVARHNRTRADRAIITGGASIGRRAIATAAVLAGATTELVGLAPGLPHSPV